MNDESIDEQGILLSPSMVRARRSGSKTQTRRVVVPPPGKKNLRITPDLIHTATSATIMEQDGVFGCSFRPFDGTAAFFVPCPFGKPGDQLWAREAFRFPKWADSYSGEELFERRDLGELLEIIEYSADVPSDQTTKGRYRHGRFMSRWASRDVMGIRGIDVQRLQDISEEDAKAEGCEPEGVDASYVLAYLTLWLSLHGDGAWDRNPWVWVLHVSEFGAELQKPTTPELPPLPDAPPSTPGNFGQVQTTRCALNPRAAWPFPRGDEVERRLAARTRRGEKDIER